MKVFCPDMIKSQLILALKCVLLSEYLKVVMESYYMEKYCTTSYPVFLSLIHFKQGGSFFFYNLLFKINQLAKFSSSPMFLQLQWRERTYPVRNVIVRKLGIGTKYCLDLVLLLFLLYFQFMFIVLC